MVVPAMKAPTRSNEEKEKTNPSHDCLKAYLSTETELGIRVRAAMEQDGYCVLSGVLTAEECLVELERMWEFVEATAPSVDRNNPDSWYPREIAPSNDVDDEANSNNTPLTHTQTMDDDPWPHSGFGFLSDMCQSYRSGWLFSELREKLAERVFEPLYGTRQLHSSKEGFTFHRPTTDTRHPLWKRRPPQVCGKPISHAGAHFDQRAAHTGLQCIQSSTALLDQTVNDGCFQCWPGSHREHARMTRDIWRGRSDWVPLTDEEVLDLERRGYTPRRVPVQRGDVILWRSDLVHCGAAPRGETPHFRAVSYTCMLPAALTPRYVAQRKLDEYWSGLSGDHRPNCRMPHISQPKKRGQGGKHQTIKGQEVVAPAQATSSYFPGGLPRLTWRQAELYGLVPYEKDKDKPNKNPPNLQVEAEILDGKLYWLPPPQQSGLDALKLI